MSGLFILVDYTRNDVVGRDKPNRLDAAPADQTMILMCEVY